MVWGGRKSRWAACRFVSPDATRSATPSFGGGQALPTEARASRPTAGSGDGRSPRAPCRQPPGGIDADERADRLGAFDDRFASEEDGGPARQRHHPRGRPTARGGGLDPLSQRSAVRLRAQPGCGRVRDERAPADGRHAVADATSRLHESLHQDSVPGRWPTERWIELCLELDNRVIAIVRG